MCYFPECFSEMKYITFLPEPTGQLLLYLWRVDVSSTNEATITTCEESLRASFRLFGDQDKVWASKICCSLCSRTLTGWLKIRTSQCLLLPEGMAWSSQSHGLDCYFCVSNTSGFSGRSKHKAEYPNITSALRTISHDDSMPVPEPPENYTLDSAPKSEETSP